MCAIIGIRDITKINVHDFIVGVVFPKENKRLHTLVKI